MSWQKVENALEFAEGIAFDGCHKIYVLMDAGQVEQSREWGYGDGSDTSQLLLIKDTPEPLSLLKQWFDGSCGLRFVEGVRTVDGDPNDGYVRLIAQGDPETEM